VRTGAAILFGLGESHEDRLAILEQLADWQIVYGSPRPVSLNWATQHPLRGRDSGTSYRYIDWSVPGGEWAEAFRNFGEATVRYPITGVEPPNLDEVFEIADIYERALFPQPYLAQGSK